MKKIGLVALACLAPALLQAQFNFNLAGRPVQIHSFASQGFFVSDQNNYLTMQTSKGSFAFTDFGMNFSMPVTDKFRIGAQLFDHNVGNLGQWQPELDWATADYRFKDWFGVRGGKVKTVFGLHNDTQDMEFLHPFALLPASVYPIDMRDSTIAHLGGDVYGEISLKHAGSLAYTTFVGDRRDNLQGGYAYLLKDRKIFFSSYTGLQYGADVRWNTPLRGFTLGAARMIEHMTGLGTAICTPAVPVSCQAFNPPGWTYGTPAPFKEYSHHDWTNQFYGQYTIGNLRIDSEFRRYYRDQITFNNLYEVWADNKGWYVAGSYRISKRLELGSYYSHLSTVYKRGPLPASLNPDSPGNHIADKVISCRFDLTKFWNLKLEGHFMDGYNNNQYPAGFYGPDNPQGLQPKTNMLAVRTGVNF